MNMVYVLYEERESSQLCGVRGVCDTWDNAVAHMRLLIENNHLYSNFSEDVYKRQKLWWHKNFNGGKSQAW